MHTEHDALPVVSGNGDSSFFVAATLAALVLAGSAMVYRKTFEQQPERENLIHTSEQPTPDDMDTEKNHPLNGHLYPDSDGVSLTTHDPDSKELKSSRSKDRRRRGKDPLKEILKGGKKVKGTTTVHAKQLFTGPTLDDLDNIPTPSSSSTRNSTPDSLSRGSGKRTQPEDRLYNLTGPPVGTVHSRPTSEVSQSNTESQIPDQPHSHQRTRDRTASFTSVSDHHVSQSSSSSHNETEDNTSILDERNPNFLIRQTPETDPTPSIFSTIIQNNNDFSEILNHSLHSSASSATTSGVITPATSPSLSYTSSKLVPHVGADSEFANNSSGSNCGPKNNSVSAGPSHAFGAETKTRKQQSSPNPTPSKSRSKSKTKAQSTWEWDNTGEVPPSSSSISASGIASAPTSSSITAPAFPPDIVYRKPPRLQPKSLWSKNVKNDGPSSIPGSVSHPSLLSPTSGSLVPSDSTLLSPSISSYLEKVPSRVSKAAKEGEGGESEDERDTTDDSYTQLEFPTLNPTSTMLASNGGLAAGPSNRPTTPRRTHGSRVPSTPSGSTPPPPLNSGTGSAQPPSTPALSTQTQLASLRGALEASRLREEKHKSEMDRYTKELESLRWENMNSRRGEVELQNHIRHLMHQLQMYSSLFASVTPQATSQQQPPQQTQGLMAGSVGLSNSGDRATSGPESGNGPMTSSPGTQHVQSPTATVFPVPPVSSPRMPLHMLPPLQLNGLSSPPSVHAPSPYFPYPMPPPPLHPHSVMPSPHPLFAQQIHHMQQQFLQYQQYQHQPHIQNQSQSPTIQAQQGNPFSMLHQPSSANIPSYQSYVASSSSSMASGSRSSSRPGTESTGSSPDLNGSLSPGPGSKRKVKTRTQTTNGYIGRRSVRRGIGDSWVVGGVGIDEGEVESIYEDEEQGGENGEGDGDDEGGGFNEILADAILKRPDSIGVRSGKKNRQALLDEEKMNKETELEQVEDNILDAVEPLTEFKFPSLSDLGNVYAGGHNRRSSSSSSSVIVSEDSGPNIFDLPALVDGSSSLDIVPFEAVVLSQNGVEELDSRNDENRPTSKTASSSPESSERTPRREESEPNIAEEPLMNSNDTEEATNVP